jgi:hypothetical protein
MATLHLAKTKTLDSKKKISEDQYAWKYLSF